MTTEDITREKDISAKIMRLEIENERLTKEVEKLNLYIAKDICTYCGDKTSNSYTRRDGEIYCGRHYMQIKTHGELKPLTEKEIKNMNKPLGDNVLYFGSDPDSRAFKPVTYDINEKGCWIITSHTLDEDGYGSLTRTINGVKHRRAHRVTYAYFKKSIEEGKSILHSCNNRACINPDHLREGGHLENMQDRLDSGNYYGEKHGTAKLTTLDVLKINTLLNEGQTPLKIGNDFSVSESTIIDIERGRTWTHTTGREKYKPKQRYPK